MLMNFLMSECAIIFYSITYFKIDMGQLPLTCSPSKRENLTERKDEKLSSLLKHVNWLWYWLKLGLVMDIRDRGPNFDYTIS